MDIPQKKKLLEIDGNRGILQDVEVDKDGYDDWVPFTHLTGIVVLHASN